MQRWVIKPDMDPETGRRTPSYPKMPKNACPKKFFGSNFSKISWTRGGIQFSPNLFTRPGLKLKLGPQHKNVTWVNTGPKQNTRLFTSDEFCVQTVHLSSRQLHHATSSYASSSSSSSVLFRFTPRLASAAAASATFITRQATASNAKIIFAAILTELMPVIHPIII